MSTDEGAAKPDSDRKVSLQTVAKISAPPPRARPTALLRTLTVRLVEVNRLSDIDIIGQRFKAEFVVQFALEGGALDEHLVDPSADFPLDGFGRPTFRPSAGWYMAQVDFNNALSYTQLDARIATDGDDLIMNLRFEGTFSEISARFAYTCPSPILPVGTCGSR